MDKIVVNATRRNVIGKQVKAMRREGKLPAVVYGFGVEPTPILLDQHEASKTLMYLPASALVTLVIDGKEYATLVREKQMDYLRNSIKHIDFQAVSLTRKIRASVNIDLHGVSPAVKDYNGLVVTNISALEVEALPAELPDRFVVDLSHLKNLGDQVLVRDLTVPAGVEILSDPDSVVVHVTATTEEKIEEVTAEPAEPEVIERGKREEEIED